MKKVIFKKILLSFFLALGLTALFCLGYNAARSYLLFAIENHTIGFLDNFDLISKIQEKCHFETIPTLAQIQETFFQIPKWFIFSLGFCILLVFMPVKEWKKNHDFHWFPRKGTINACFESIWSSYKSANKFYFVIICVLFLTQYSLCHYIIYLSWMSGDDYYCGMTLGQPLIVKFAWWIWSNLTHVSRIGEMIYYIFPQTIDRPMNLWFTPFVFSLFPFIITRVLSNNKDYSWCNFKGACRYLVLSCMIYLGLAHLTTFCCYAVVCAYIYSTLFVLFMLPLFMNLSRWNQPHSVLYIMLLMIGSFICGQSTEGISVIMTSFLGILFIYMLYQHFVNQKKLYPAFYLPLISFWIGACWILLSTGTIIRGMNTPLTGGNVPYNLTGMSLLQKITYLPEMFYAIWKLAYIDLLVFAFLLSLCMVLILKNRERREYYIPIIKKACLFLFVAILLAVVYLVGAIPNGSTLTPCSFMIIAVDAYLMVSIEKAIKSSFIHVLLSVVLVVVSYFYIQPAIEYAKYLKPFDELRTQRIFEQKKQGIQDVILPSPFPEDFDPEKSKLFATYIQPGYAFLFGVKSITEEGAKEFFDKEE